MEVFDLLCNPPPLFCALSRFFFRARALRSPLGKLLVLVLFVVGEVHAARWRFLFLFFLQRGGETSPHAFPHDGTMPRCITPSHTPQT